MGCPFFKGVLLLKGRAPTATIHGVPFFSLYLLLCLCVSWGALFLKASLFLRGAAPTATNHGVPLFSLLFVVSSLDFVGCPFCSLCLKAPGKAQGKKH